jgi:ankyrin repeat protein
VDGTDEDGRTLLHVAVLHNLVSFVRALLSPSLSSPSSPSVSSFSPDLRDAYGNTALHTAASVGALEVAVILVQSADRRKVTDFLEMKNALGRSALHVASFYGHLPFVEFLISKVCLFLLVLTRHFFTPIRNNACLV